VPVAHVTLAPPSFSISAQQEYEVKHLLNQTRLNTETGKWQVPVVYLTEFINVENIVDPHHATFKNGNKPENWEQICGVCRSSGMQGRVAAGAFLFPRRAHSRAPPLARPHSCAHPTVDSGFPIPDSSSDDEKMENFSEDSSSEGGSEGNENEGNENEGNENEGNEDEADGAVDTAPVAKKKAPAKKKPAVKKPATKKAAATKKKPAPKKAKK